MSIKLSDDLADQIKRHGESTFPEECGGLLLGKLEDDIRVIHEVYPLENIRKDSRHNRVELDPLAYSKAEREATKRGLGVWGYYHSHPNHPAVPSEYDRDHAPFTEWSYVIVSIHDGKAQDIRSWNLSDDRSKFIEEKVL